MRVVWRQLHDIRVLGLCSAFQISLPSISGIAGIAPDAGAPFATAVLATCRVTLAEKVVQHYNRCRCLAAPDLKRLDTFYEVSCSFTKNDTGLFYTRI